MNPSDEPIDGKSMIEMFGAKHRMSEYALDDMIKCMNHIQSNNVVNLPSSRYMLRKNVLDNVPIKYTKRYYSFCCNIVRKEQMCQCPIFLRQDSNTIITFDLNESLHYLVRTNLKHIKNVKRVPEDAGEVWSDITEGSAYQNRLNYIDEDVLPLSLILSYDDANMVQSHSYKLCPNSFTLAEIPLPERAFDQNIMTAGIWFGPDAPNVSVFWKETFLKQYEASRNTYFEVMDGDEHFYFDIEILCVVMDKVAKAKTLNMQAPGGYFACAHCFQKGRSIEVGNGSARIFDHPSNASHKTKTNIQQCVTLLESRRRLGNHVRHIKGIKGRSFFSSVIDISFQVPCDIMHSMFLGTCRHILTDVTIIKPSWYEQINQKLRVIKVPTGFTRKPMNMKMLKMWKASEFRNFFLHFYIVLRNVVSNPHFVMITSLSAILKIITCWRLTENDLREAEKLTDTFLTLVPSVFGEPHM